MNTKSKITTKGGVVIEDIQIGDILYEFEYGFCIKSQVVSLPKKEVNGSIRYRLYYINSTKLIN